jgi:hypothetical protein
VAASWAAPCDGRVSEDEVCDRIDVARTSAAKIIGVAIELCPERLPLEVFNGPTGDIKVDGPRAHQVYYPGVLRGTIRMVRVQRCAPGAAK